MLKNRKKNEKGNMGAERKSKEGNEEDRKDGLTDILANLHVK